MKRKAVLLIVGCTILTVTYMSIQSALRPRHFAEGRILLNLSFVSPTNPPPITNWYYWYFSQPSVISNLWIQNRSILLRDSAAENKSIYLMEVYPVRSTRILLVRFGGDEKDSVWRAASNTCAMLAGFYATNRPFEGQTTNLVTCEVEHHDTRFWTPTPYWRRVLDKVEQMFRR